MDLPEDLDTTVTVTGTAVDLHAGAVVERPGHRDVHVGGLAYWPVELRGRPVEATGVLRSRPLGGGTGVSAIGVVTHGQAGGEVLVLDEASWRPVD